MALNDSHLIRLKGFWFYFFYPGTALSQICIFLFCRTKKLPWVRNPCYRAEAEVMYPFS